MANNQMRIKCVLTSMILLISFVCTGCWDRREIEDLGTVVGLAFDVAHDQNVNEGKETGTEKNSSHGDMEDMEEGNIKGQFRMTLQYVIPKSVGGENSGGSNVKEPYINLQSEGNSVLHLINDMYNISSRITRYDHLKAIIISEEVARSFNLYKFLNAVIKHPEVPYTSIVVISQGTASSILDTKTDLEMLPAFEVNMIARSVKHTSNRPNFLTFGAVSRKMAQGMSFAIQRVSNENDTIKITGAAIIKGGEFKLAGWLNEWETGGLNWIMGDADGGTVEILSKDTGEIVSCWINKCNSKIKPVVKDNNIDFIVEIESEAIISEDWSMSSGGLSQDYIKKVEEQATEEIKSVINSTLEKLQKEYKADVAEFGKALKIKYPKIWESVKDNWDEHFSKSRIDVDINFNIRSSARKFAK